MCKAVRRTHLSWFIFPKIGCSAQGPLCFSRAAKVFRKSARAFFWFPLTIGFNFVIDPVPVGRDSCFKITHKIMGPTDRLSPQDRKVGKEVMLKAALIWR